MQGLFFGDCRDKTIGENVNPNPKKIWLIEWHDAHSAPGWHSKFEVERFIKQDRCICQNVGWILSETKDEIVLACRRMKWAQEGDTEWGMLQKIPKAWIRKKVICNLKGERHER